MSEKFTPGPWHDVATMYHSETQHRVITGGPHGLPHVAYIPKNSYAASFGEALANARLIAQAPALYEIAKRVANGGMSYPKYDRDLAKAAVAAVEGK